MELNFSTSNPFLTRKAALLPSLALIAFSPPSLMAATGTWGGTGSTSSTSDYNNVTNWSGNIAVPGGTNNTTDQSIFTNLGNTSVTMPTAKVARLEFKGSGAYTISGGSFTAGSGADLISLTSTNAASQIILSDIYFGAATGAITTQIRNKSTSTANTLTIGTSGGSDGRLGGSSGVAGVSNILALDAAGGDKIIFNGVISDIAPGKTGSSNLALITNSGAAGTYSLNGANTFSGGTEIYNSSNTLTLGNKAALGTGELRIGGGSTTTVNANTTLTGTDKITNDIRFNGAYTTVTNTTSVTPTGVGANTVTVSDATNLAVGQVLNYTTAARVFPLGTYITGISGLTVTLSNALPTGITVANGTIASGSGRFLAYGSGSSTTNFDGSSAIEFSGTTYLGSERAAAGTSTQTFNVTNTAGVTFSGKLTEQSSIQAGAGPVIGALTKTGSGTLTLSSVNNDYTGATLISAGTLNVTGNLGATNVTVNGSTAKYTVGANDTVGTVTLTDGTIDGAGTLTATTTYSVAKGTISAKLSGSAVTLTKTSGNTVTVSGNNDYTGNLNVNAGKLVIAGTEVHGVGQLIVNSGGTLTFGDGSSTVGSATSNDAIFVNNTSKVEVNKTDGGTVANQVASNPSAVTTLAGVNATGTTNSFTGISYSNGGSLTTLSTTSGAVLAFTGGTGSANGALDIKGTTLNVTGAGNTLITATSGSRGIYNSTGAGAVTKAGAGTLIYQADNGYTGQTAIDAGTVRVDVAQSSSGTYFVGNGGTTGTAAALLVGGGSDGTAGGVTFGRTISINKGSGGNRIIGGTNTAGTNTITSAIDMTGSFGDDKSVTLTAAAGGTVDITGAVTGAGQNITKTGLGTVILSNASGNTYTGNTSVNAGKLVVKGALTGTAVSVSGAGTILASDAAASIGTSLTINNGAILAAGDAATAGTITVGGATTFNDGSIFSWDIDDTSASYDKMITTAATDGGSAGGAVFRIVASDALVSAGFWNTPKSWTNIFTTDGSTVVANWANAFGSAVSVVNSNFGSISPVGGSFSLSGNSLIWTAVPEPTSALAGLLLGAGLLRRRRID